MNMLPRKLKLSITLLLFLSPTLLISQQTRIDLPVPHTRYTLKNGLKVIISEDYSIPLVSVVVAYKVGSLYEQPGKTGAAHLMENLMFQGSKNISRMQHISIVNKTGGVISAATTEDKTLFFQTVPSNHLALVLWLESDRMKSLTIDPDVVNQAKNAIIEEIRQRRASDPYLQSRNTFDQLVYQDFAYYHPVFGIESDLRRITDEDVKALYTSYYVPNNAVLCITGDVDAEKTLGLVRKYFETIPAGKNVPALVSSPFQETNGDIIRVHEDSLATYPGFYIGYRIDSPRSKDYFPLKIIEYILLRGNSSRLNRRLIIRDRTALHVSGGLEVKKDRGVFHFFVTSLNEALMLRSQRTVISEIDRLRTNLIPERELKKALNLFELDFRNRYSTNLDRAFFLIDTLFDSESGYQTYNLGNYLRTTAANIQVVANRYFFQKRITLNVNTR
jgi:predicted Zn-dependent peptidase